MILFICSNLAHTFGKIRYVKIVYISLTSSTNSGSFFCWLWPVTCDGDYDLWSWERFRRPGLHISYIWHRIYWPPDADCQVTQWPQVRVVKIGCTMGSGHSSKNEVFDGTGTGENLMPVTFASLFHFSHTMILLTVKTKQEHYTAP